MVVAGELDPDGPGNQGFSVGAHVHPSATAEGGIEVRIVSGNRGGLPSPPADDIRFALAGLYAWATTPSVEPLRPADDARGGR